LTTSHVMHTLSLSHSCVLSVAAGTGGVGQDKARVCDGWTTEPAHSHSDWIPGAYARTLIFTHAHSPTHPHTRTPTHPHPHIHSHPLHTHPTHTPTHTPKRKVTEPLITRSYWPLAAITVRLELTFHRIMSLCSVASFFAPHNSSIFSCSRS
jgi:hypothetical protein